MKRWETLLALAGVIAASIGALHVPGRGWWTVSALAMLAVVAAARLRAALAGRRNDPTDAAERAARIREQRRRR
jgi:membrane protein implicated in regulation of membrane protease activity